VVGTSSDDAEMDIDYASNLGWHEGEQQMHHMLHVPARENPTSQGLTPHGVRILHMSSLLALATLDDRGRPVGFLLSYLLNPFEPFKSPETDPASIGSKDMSGTPIAYF